MTFRGAMTALVTPFKDGQIDQEALSDLVEWQIAQGIDGLVPCGTTGESITLSAEEHARVINIVVERAKRRVPVLAGAGAASTRHTVELCQAAKEAKADGVLLVAPYYNRPSPQGLVAHFEAVLREVSFPTVLYNIPKRTGVDMDLAVLERLSALSDIVGIKEATGQILRSQDIVAAFGTRFCVLSGDDTIVLGILAVGGQGVISVTSNVVPDRIARVVSLFDQGKICEARTLHQSLLPLHTALFLESNPGPVKAALAHLNKISLELRLPLVQPERAILDKIRDALTDVTGGT
ncbi:MAG: 4-hydroxy-tetrahydrodipicolinate synthase [Myxococcales bacterium]|nr:4-hydroxy-tetrahydrodipicolinate synthase [Myxococcales bacterium]